MKLARRAVATRETINGLRPPILDEQGIVPAIEYLVSEMCSRGMDVRLQHESRLRMPSVLEATVYRIVQEARERLAGIAAPAPHR